MLALLAAILTSALGMLFFQRIVHPLGEAQNRIVCHISDALSETYEKLKGKF